jgi:hypothetical protein
MTNIVVITASASLLNVIHGFIVLSEATGAAQKCRQISNTLPESNGFSGVKLVMLLSTISISRKTVSQNRAKS